MGLYIKVVERTGRRLSSLFPLTNLWGGVSCGREDECTTCNQGAEDCTKQSLIYENVCARCVPEAKSKKPLGSRELSDSTICG